MLPIVPTSGTVPSWEDVEGMTQQEIFDLLYPTWATLRTEREAWAKREAGLLETIALINQQFVDYKAKWQEFMDRYKDWQENRGFDLSGLLGGLSDTFKGIGGFLTDPKWQLALIAGGALVAYGVLKK